MSYPDKDYYCIEPFDMDYFTLDTCAKIIWTSKIKN